MTSKAFTKKQVEYTDDHKDSPEYCKICGHYVNRTTCRILVNGGPIEPEGWCSKFYYKTGFTLKAFMVRGEAA